MSDAPGGGSVLPHPLHHVGPVDPGRRHMNEHIVWPDDRHRAFDERQDIRRSGLADFNGMHKAGGILAAGRERFRLQFFKSTLISPHLFSSVSSFSSRQSPLRPSLPEGRPRRRRFEHHARQGESDRETEDQDARHLA